MLTKMLRYINANRSILSLIPTLKSCKLFHISSKVNVRGAKITNSREHENLEKEFNPSLVHQNSNADFFGIESDEGVITLSSPQNPLPSTARSRKQKEKFHSTSFGVVRYDADNQLKYHGQYHNRTEFVFPHGNNEDAEVSKELPKLAIRSASSSKQRRNDQAMTENFEYHSPEKSVQEENYIDKYYFGNISEKDNLNSNNDPARSSEKLSFVDQEYFDSLTTSENVKPPDSVVSAINRNIFDEEHSVEANHVTQSTPQESHFIDKNYFRNLSVSENKISPNKQDFSSDVLNPDAIFGLHKKAFSDLSNSESSEEYLKSLTVHNKHFNVESSYVTQECDDINEPDAAFSSEIKSNKENTVSDVKMNQNNKIFNKDFVQNIKANPILDKFAYSKETFPPDLKYKTDNVKDVEVSQLSEPANKDYDKELKEALQDDSKRPHFSSDTLKSNLISRQKRRFLDSDASSTTNENQSKQSLASDESEDASTAYDFVTKLRKEQEVPEHKDKKEKSTTEEKLDSKGFRILKNQVEDLSYFTRDEIFNILKNSVVYSDDDLLVLNKPYGLVIHDSKTTKFPCLSTFLNDLAKELDRKSTDPKLFTVHRLDKETTGCLLLARNEVSAQYLKSLFVQRQIIKKYWIVTIRVPNPPEGVIDMPISEGSVNGIRRMVLHPKLPKDIPYKNHSRHGKEAITSYQVISESGNAALVEVCPKTGIKHQIRIHFGFGLSCPVLGDHKYSHLDKLAPQKLPSDILQKLNVRQSKVRYIPMHIHAKSVIIPHYFKEEKRDLFVNIPIPKHMAANLKKMKFRKK